MGNRNENFIDDTTFEFPRAGFWAVHAIGAAALFLAGMRFAVRRAPLPIVAYRAMRSLMRR